jgi:hypothetical protein
MRALTPILSERFVINVILYYMRLPKIRLRRLVRQIEGPPREPSKSLTFGSSSFVMYSRAYYKLPPLGTPVFASYFDIDFALDLPPPKLALCKARNALRGSDMELMEELTDDLAQHYPLEALAVMT